MTDAERVAKAMSEASRPKPTAAEIAANWRRAAEAINRSAPHILTTGTK